MATEFNPGSASSLNEAVKLRYEANLNTNAYTDSEKAKLSGIEDNAEVNTVLSVAGKTGAVTLVKGDIGLGNVDNTADLNKPISTATQSALDLKADAADLGDLATQDTVSVSDISATGTPSGSTYLRGDGSWATPAGGGGGDMSASTYDPNSVNGDAFDMDNMVEGSTNFILTSSERSKLSGIEAGAEVNPGNATTSVAGLMSASDKSKLDGIASGAEANPGNATTSAAGLMSAADKTKLNGIEIGADVTDATNVASAGAVMDGDFSTNGVMARTSAGGYASRTITAGTGVSVTNGNGVSGNPTIALSSGAQASLSLADTALQSSDIANMVESDTTGISGADAITNIVSLTQAEYNAIGSPNSSTLYVITDA